MLDEKIKLEQYFKDEINRVSEIEIQEIEDEIVSIREKTIQEMESDEQRVAYMAREQILKEMQSEHAIALSKVHEETNRKLMAKRREIALRVFNEAIEKIKEFTMKKDYVASLNKKAKDLATTSYDQVVFYVARKDEHLLSGLCEAFGKNSEGKVDPEILVGGFRMECESKGIVIDETFDAAIDEQRNWFYTNSGLIIK